MTADLITAWATAATAIIAIIALMAESRKSRMALVADVMLRMQEKFDSQRMIIVRKKAVKAIQDFRSKKTDKLSDDVDDVLDFFEEVALLARRTVIDKKSAWHAFYFWIDGYWWATIDYINSERKNSPTQWEDLFWLHRKLVEIENEGEKRPASTEHRMTEDEIKDFLEGEERYFIELDGLN